MGANWVLRKERIEIMKKGIAIAIILVLLLTVMIPQTVFASSYIDAGGQTQDYKLFFRGGAEPAATDAINVYWGDFQTKGQNYLISWKKTEDTKWQQVEIEDPCDQYDKVKSYKIEGLLPNQDYDIKISAILLNEKGEKVYTSPIETVGHTYVTAPAYEAYSCVYSGDYVESIWQVFERNAVLKIYRAESQNGTYKYVGSTDGRETLGRANCKDVQGRVVFRDETALPGKSYYYKAVSEVKLADGTVMESESTRPYNLTSKNKPYGQYTTKLLNQRGTYAKTLTWKLVSDKANYKTVLEKNQFTMHSVYSLSLIHI